MIQSLASSAAAQSLASLSAPQSQVSPGESGGPPETTRTDSTSFSREALALLHAEHGPDN